MKNESLVPRGLVIGQNRGFIVHSCVHIDPVRANDGRVALYTVVGVDSKSEIEELLVTKRIVRY
jgi:hypothetical protein